MNKTHRTLWNPALGAWVAAPETARSRGQRSHRSTPAAVVGIGLLLGALGAPAAQAQFVGLNGGHGGKFTNDSGANGGAGGTSASTAGSPGDSKIGYNVLGGGGGGGGVSLSTGAGGGGGSSSASDRLVLDGASASASGRTNAHTSVHAGLGRMWAIGGQAGVQSQLQASLGLRVRW